MKKNIVYVLTEGEYSDYGIIGASTTREGAELLQSALGGDIEEIEDNSPYYKEGFHAWEVQMGKDASIKGCEKNPSYCTFGFYPHNGDSFQTWCWAKSPEHAVKTANERRAQIIAHDAWGDVNKCEQLFDWAKEQ